MDRDDWIDKKTVETLVWLMKENNAYISSIIYEGYYCERGEVIIGTNYKMLLHILYTSSFEI